MGSRVRGATTRPGQDTDIVVMLLQMDSVLPGEATCKNISILLQLEHAVPTYTA